MALKEYEWNGGTWQFDESLAPIGAIMISKDQSEDRDQSEDHNQPKDQETDSVIRKSNPVKNKARTASNKADDAHE